TGNGARPTCSASSDSKRCSHKATKVSSSNCSVGRSRRRPQERHGMANHLVRITPFVVVPAHDLHQVAVDYLRHGEIDQGCARIADHIARYDRVLGDTENAPVAVAL